MRKLRKDLFGFFFTNFIIRLQQRRDDENESNKEKSKNTDRNGQFGK